MAIISTSDFKTFRNISVSTYDALIGVLIGAGQAQAERYCDRVFDTATYTEKYDGNRTNTLVLRNIPVTTLTSISTIDSSGNTSALDSTSYTYEAATGIVKPCGDAWGWYDATDTDPQDRRWGDVPAFGKGHQNYQVVYTGGYSSGTMPADLKLAMYLYVGDLFENALQAYTSSGLGGLGPFKSQTLGDWSYTLAGESGLLQMANGDWVSSSWAKFANLFNPFRRVV